MRLSVGETAKLIGVSVRTLRYYDEIGLLTPCETSEAGYRLYDEENLAKLQQILFYRELSFSLKDITKMFSHPDYDRTLALKNHRELLLLKREQIDGLISLVDATLEGAETMNKHKFTMTDITAAKEKYAEEARERWGTTDAYRESLEKEKGRSDEESARMMEQMNELIASFAALRGHAPADEAVQALVKRYQAHISKCYYQCTDEILAGLGEMYQADDRFLQSLDRFGEGTAKLMSDAIQVYCGSQK